MTVNGTNISYVSDGFNIMCASGSGGSADAKSYSGGLGTDSLSYLNVEFGQFATGQSVGMPTDSAFFSFFHTGDWTYGDADNSPNKVMLTMYENGVSYSSACGPQTGSNFQITEMQTFTPQFQYGVIKARITFNCKIYSCSSGVLSKTITNGTAVIGMDNY